MTRDALKPLLDEGAIRPVDWAFAQFIAQRATAHREWMAQVAALLSNKLGEQDTCVELDVLPLHGLAAQAPVDVSTLKARLLASGVVQDAEQAEPDAVSKPLVCSQNRLYLQRYWVYEQQLLAQIMRLSEASLAAESQDVAHWCEQLFGPDSEATDWQRVAVCLAARQKLALITGGPGTGKTTTVTRLLAMRQGIAFAQGRALNIALVAPTGKAAARLSESISAAKLGLPETLRQHIPSSCSTIHRLLGTVPGRQQFRFNAANPLHLDMLVVDEVSMVDLPLMSKLFAALPEHAQIILLGDKDQLASVEAGSVLSDITTAALGQGIQSRFSEGMLQWLRATGNQVTPETRGTASEAVRPLADNLVVLQKSHRFSSQSDVGQLARAINAGDSNKALGLLQDSAYPQIQLIDQRAYEPLLNAVLPGLKEVILALKHNDLERAFQALMKQQVLCAQRVGEWGVESLNALIEQALTKIGLIDSTAEFYLGRPVMLSQNDHNQSLYNGDIGLVMPDENQPDLLKVWFPLAEGGFRGIIPNRLPAHETLYSMTIHKSQGSEFANVHLCLPLMQKGVTPRGLSRELLYTGLTRARERFAVYTQPGLLRGAISQRCARSSGLTDALLSVFPA